MGAQGGGHGPVKIVVPDLCIPVRQDQLPTTTGETRAAQGHPLRHALAGAAQIVRARPNRGH